VKSLVSSTDLVAYRQGQPLFAPFNMEVCRGMIAVIRGANGTGKSTLLNCLSNQYFDRTGRLRCASNSLSYLPQGQRHPQTVPLSELAPLAVGYCAERYHQLLDKLEIPPETAARLPSILSGGELQKARLLLALLRSHDVLFLDEPFANMDKQCRPRVLNELERTRSSRATVLISHPSDVESLELKEVSEFELRQPEH
jgi:ABC-type multidrug transport system ATPase subunit